jgi:polyhydroxyalkanoate synthase
VRLALDNSIVRADGLEVLGSPVDLQRVDVDSYVVAGLNDHIVPWENAYRSTQLLGGESRFVLSTSGHIQALVNPPAKESRASYRVADEHPADPHAFLDQAPKLPGSWWPDYVQWLGERSGDLRPAPAKLGGGGRRALDKAPGTYVFAS